MSMQSELFQQMRAGSPLPSSRTVRLNGKSWTTSPVFDAYWAFAAERQGIFYRRVSDIQPFTQDPILRKFKFTNAYRVLDRTTQYLIRDVILQSEPTETNVFFRILLFKLFNKIETWQLLTAELGELTFKGYRFERYDRVLTKALEVGRRIYSAAYIMPSGGPKAEGKKHRSHLLLLEKMLREEVPKKLASTRTMREGFALLRSYPMIGDFLAYQFITDLNYSDLTEFSEMEFVMPGPGALDGLKKCFPQMVPSDAPSLIRAVCEQQEDLQRELGIEPVSLYGRPLQLIDCQNLFCETDKYARVSYPEIAGFSGRTRIKQSFRMTGPIPKPVFPVKWGLAAVPHS